MCLENSSWGGLCNLFVSVPSTHLNPLTDGNKEITSNKFGCAAWWYMYPAVSARLMVPTGLEHVGHFLCCLASFLA